MTDVDEVESLSECDDTYGLVIASIPKSKTHQLRIALNEYEGHRYIDIREFYWNGDEYHPTKKGVTLKVSAYPELLQAIASLGEALGYDVEG